MDEPRTYKITSPYMKGSDVEMWQGQIVHEFDRMGIKCPIKIDGIWAIASRSYNASLCHALGMNASEVMAEGITPELRIRIRNRRLTTSEKERFSERVDYRRNLRDRWDNISVARPTIKIIEDSWGYHPGTHDGIDIITPPKAMLFSMVRARVFDVRSGGWWGKAPSGDVTKGDGIVQMEILETIGPFLKGRHIGYGHAENAMVDVGDIVNAGDPVARAGLAVAWHIHLMYNTGGTNKGIGNINPRKILDYAVKNG